jgi:hypothetical protein
MAYVVGLIATDGCLSNDGRHIVFTSRDRLLVETYLRCLGRPLRISSSRTRRGDSTYYAQFSDVALYDWLLSVGITPRKSLTLGGIEVPRAYLLPLVRGLLDGDGSISSFTHRPTAIKYPAYTYTRLWVFFLSASDAHIGWLRGQIESAVGIVGGVSRITREGRHDLFRLKYGNRESAVLLKLLYADRTSPCLERKRAVWDSYEAQTFCAEGGT